jgi:hypothetical protein
MDSESENAIKSVDVTTSTFGAAENNGPHKTRARRGVGCPSPCIYVALKAAERGKNGVGSWRGCVPLRVECQRMQYSATLTTHVPPTLARRVTHHHAHTGHHGHSSRQSPTTSPVPAKQHRLT